MRSNKLIFLIVAFILFGLLIYQIINRQDRIPQKVTSQSNPLPSPSELGKVESLDEFIKSALQPDDEVAKIVFNDKNAFKIVRDEVLWVFGAYKAKLQDQTTDNIVLWGPNVACGSCHEQWIYVLAGDKIIYKHDAGDPTVEITKDDQGKDTLTITEPIRQNDEAWSSPSVGVKTSYRWNAKTSSFEGFYSRPYWYKYR